MTSPTSPLFVLTGEASGGKDLYAQNTTFTAETRKMPMESVIVLTPTIGSPPCTPHICQFECELARELT